MKNTVFDKDFAIEKDPILERAIYWWERKRLLFNSIVGISGFLPILLSLQSISKIDTVSIIIYGLLANLLFTSGFILEALIFYYTEDKFRIENYRVSLFVIGTSVYSLMSFFGSLYYFNT